MIEASHKKTIRIIFLTALILRLLFLFVGAEYLYGDKKFENNDSFSFQLGFINLVEEGHYSFDLTNPDASYGRLPGYPLFWGMHYMISKDHANLLTAISQIFLDSIAAVLCFFIALSTSHSFKASLLTGLFYSINPFFILWTTIIGTEALGVFITLLFFYLLLHQKLSPNTKALLIGLVAVVAFYIRPYLGIFIPIGALYLFIVEKRMTSSVIASTVFVIIFSLWPIRNYQHSSRFIPLKGETPGYHRFSKDILSSRAWLLSWTKEVGLYTDLMTDQNVKADSIFHDVKRLAFQKDGITEAVKKARQCGTGFYHWTNHKVPSYDRCDEEAAALFDVLKEQYKSRYPVRYWLDIPFQNFKYYFFKFKLAERSSTILEILLIFRFLAVLISIIGFLILLNKRKYYLIAFPVFMLVFISVFMRHLEMRYMLQAESILFCFSGVGVLWFFNLLNGWMGKSKIKVTD